MNSDIYIRPSQVTYGTFCPSFLTLGRRCAALEVDHVAGRTGTTKHEAVAECFKAGATNIIEAYKFMAALSMRGVLDHSASVEAANMVVTTMGTILEHDLDPVTATIEVELEVSIPVEHMTPGHVDIVFVWPDNIIAFDYKFGRNSLPPAQVNGQILSYAIGLYATYRRPVTFYLMDWKMDVTEVRIMDETDMIQSINHVSGMVEHIFTSNEERPGWWCAYCPAFGVLCDTSKTLMELTMDKITVLTGDAEKEAEALKDLLAIKPAIDNASARAQKAMKDMKAGGAALPEGVVVSQRKGRKFIRLENPEDTRKLFTVLYVELNLDKSTLLECCDIRRSRLIDAMVRDHGMTPETAEREVDDALRKSGFLHAADGTTAVYYRQPKQKE